MTSILLGSQWKEASGFIGLWGLTSAITIIFSHYSSEIYRAKGKPKLSVLAQILHIIVLWPTVLFAVKYGFETLYTARALIRLELILVNLFILYRLINISPKDMLKNVYSSIVASIIMALISFKLLLYDTSILWQFFVLLICIIAYFGIMLLFPENRSDVKYFISKYLRIER